MEAKDKKTGAAAYQAVQMFSKYQQIYVKRARGFFDNIRIVMVILTQLAFYGLLWLTWNDRQAVLFHLVERKFYIFGLVFWPQDIIYLSVILIVAAYGLFLVTAVAGRLFCGYACPQTVYTQIFMWVENWIEGDRNARIKRDQAPWSADKFARKAAKHLIWGLIALWTGFTLAGYFSPVHELWTNLTTWNLGGWEAFWIFFYAGFTYLLAGHMRELVCRHMCPYARFQSVMFDPDTMIITYDARRGEPRGLHKTADQAAPAGDCVDCELCIRVCPTGIDIRNGLQYECIGCASCIDVCDEVMDKVGKPRGLVRYSTENAMAANYDRLEIFRHVIRPRIVVYTGILLLVMSLAGWFLAHRIPLKVDIIRDRTALTREAEDGRIENLFTLNIMNTEERAHRFELGVSGLPDIAIIGETVVDVPPATARKIVVPVLVDPGAGKPGANPIRFSIAASDDPAIRVEEKSSMILPQ